jgi:nitroreductase
MKFADVIAKRRSIRKYKPDAVPEAKLRKLHEALRMAPTAANRQSFAFVFVHDKAKREQIAKEAGHQEFLSEAPVLMVAVCEPGASFDVAIAVDHMIMTATDEGLGTCWVGWFEREPVKRILGIPEAKEVPILVTIGLPAEQPEARPRKPLEELIMRDQYRQPKA